jgi:hypothetical protein
VKLSVTNTDSPWALPDDQCPDVYFTRGYGEAAASAAGGVWEAVHCENHIIVPYVVRRIDDRYVDATSPYGYSGIYVEPGCSPVDLRQFWRLATDHWRDQGMVAMFLRFPPFDEHSVRAAASLTGITVTHRSDTITVPVDRRRDGVWDGMEGRSRTAIRKATKAGLSAELCVADAADVSPGSPFRRLYESTMARVGSGPGYVFPDVYYERLQSALGPSLRIAAVRLPDGEVVSTALVLVHRGLVHYHLAGSTVAGARLGANNLLLWTILGWAADTGRDLVHLGGGLGREDNLFRFKRSFGGRRTPFSTGTVTTDPAAYRVLVARRAAQLGVTPDELERHGYFPAYRFGSDVV